MKKHDVILLSSILLVSFLGIGVSMIGISNPENREKQDGGNHPLAAGATLSSYQQEKDLGIGPVKNLKLGPIDKKMVDAGKTLFTAKCVVCHEMDTKKVGPPLRNITKERTPEYIMNLLVNATQMQKEDVFVKELFKKYNNVPMPDPQFNQAQARSVLEYLRSVAK